jgi:hypothetical protein
MGEQWTAVIPGLWRHAYTTGMGIHTNAYAIAYGDGEIAVFSPPVAADDALFQATDALGRVTALVAPNTGHDLGQQAWQDRYPDATAYAPEVAIPALHKAKPKLRPFQPLAALAARMPPSVHLVDVPGTTSGMTLWTVEAGDQRAMFVDELVSNQTALSGPPPIRFLFWATGSGPGLARNRFWTWIFCKDKRLVAKGVLGEVAARNPTIMLPGHGEPIRDGAAEAIRSQVQPIA